MKRIYGIAIGCIACFSSPLFGQQFENGELDGDALNSSNIPFFWESIPHTDPICEANSSFGSTPDVTNIDGPVPNNGILGQPFSGETFVSSLYGPSHHEGLQQLVSGFIPGVEYDISYYQTVVKQISVDAVDTTGSWAVYVDTELVGVGEMTTSHLSALDVNLNWEFRSLTFTASADAHTLKFIPADDDTIHEGSAENGMLRVGLDLISLSFHTSTDELSLQAKTTIFPNPFKENFTIDLSNHRQNVILEVFNAQGKLVKQERLAADRRHEMAIHGSAGVYLARLRDENGDRATFRLVKH